MTVETISTVTVDAGRVVTLTCSIVTVISSTTEVDWLVDTLHDAIVVLAALVVKVEGIVVVEIGAVAALHELATVTLALDTDDDGVATDPLVAME